jgi:glycosyltransferase involved in cell wall biosynthesis
LEACAPSERHDQVPRLQNQSELPALYNLGDAMVLRSMFKTWGPVVNEAMNAGKAIVASDRAGCASDLVRDRENGFVFRAGDVAELARAVREVAASAERCAAMGCNSLEVISHWSFGEDVQGLRAALASI